MKKMPSVDDLDTLYKKLLKNELLRIMAREGDFQTHLPGLMLYRRNHNDLEHIPILYKPALIIIANGSKNIRIGEDNFTYGAGSYFVTGIDIPTACAVQDASQEQPFLSLSLD